MGHSISKIQTRILKSLMTKKIVVAFDEGLTEAEIQVEARKLLVQAPMFQNNVFYIFDDTGENLKKGSKDSPTDNGKKVFQKLIKNNLKRLDSGTSE